MARIEYTITGDANNKKLEMQGLNFPDRCACCGSANPGSSYKGAIGIITGYQRSGNKDITKYIWKEWDVPYCSFCLEHDKDNAKRSNAIAGTFWGIVLWAIVVVIGAVNLHASTPTALAVFMIGLVMILVVWGRKAIKKTKRKPLCYVPTLISSPRCFSINDGKFSSKSPLSFTFFDKNYERDFLELNGLAPKSQVKELTIHEAAAKGEIDQVRKLLVQGTHIDTRDEAQNAPLHRAATFGQVEVAKFLLEQGADPNIRGMFGFTPLNCTMGGRSDASIKKELVSLLLGYHADPNGSNFDGRVALMDAAEGSLDICKLLIEAGANVNAQSHNGETPLLLAALRGQNEIVKLLLERGAKVDTADIDGYTPLKSAEANGHKEVADLLRQSSTHSG